MAYFCEQTSLKDFTSKQLNISQVPKKGLHALSTEAYLHQVDIRCLLRGQCFGCEKFVPITPVL